MNWIIIGFVIVSLVLIFILKGNLPNKIRSRDQFLKEIEKFVDGRLEPISDQPNSFRIIFNFEGQEFVYEDLESLGFKDKVYKTYLKLKTPSKLTLSFTEKKSRNVEKNKVRITSALEEMAQRHTKVHLPKELEKNFNVNTNNAVQTNLLFRDKKAANVFVAFKNFDASGHPFMSLKIISGFIILEFHPSGTLHPRPLSLQISLQSLEEYLDKLLIVAKQLKD